MLKTFTNKFVRRTFQKKFLLPSLARVVSFVFVFTNIVFAHKPQESVWSERKNSYEVASLPVAGVGSPKAWSSDQLKSNLINQIPSVSSALKNPESVSFKRKPHASPVVNDLPSALFAHVTLREVFQKPSSPNAFVGDPSGFPTETFGNDGFVLLIEDVHQNLEAQTHISKAIQAMGEAPGTIPVRIGLEGAYGGFIYDAYKALPNKDINIAVADSFLQSGDIGGPAHAGFSYYKGDNMRGVTFRGVDSPVWYPKNVAAYRAASKQKNAVSKTLASLKMDLEERKRSAFSSQLSAYDRVVESHRRGELEFPEYVKKLDAIRHSRMSLSVPFHNDNYAGTVPTSMKSLSGTGIQSVILRPQAEESHEILHFVQVDKPGFPTETFGNDGLEPSLTIETFLQAYEMEKSMNFELVEAERQKILEKLVARMSEKDVQALMQFSLGYREGQVGFAEYYDHLRALCRRHGVNLAQAPRFDDYVRYVLLADGIKADQLFKDVADLEEKNYDVLSTTPEEKRLVAESRWLYLAGELVNFRLTSDQWEIYQKLSIKSSSPKFVVGDPGKRTRSGFPITTFGNDGLKAFEQFYLAADKRNEAMVSGLLGTRHEVRGTAVLVAGGFHTSGLTNLLKERGIPYVVVTPKISKIDQGDATHYLSVFDREKTPLERLFTGQKLFMVGELAGRLYSMSDVRDPASQLTHVSFALQAGIVPGSRVPALAEDASRAGALQTFLGVEQTEWGTVIDTSVSSGARLRTVVSKTGNRIGSWPFTIPLFTRGIGATRVSVFEGWVSSFLPWRWRGGGALANVELGRVEIDPETGVVKNTAYVTKWFNAPLDETWDIIESTVKYLGWVLLAGAGYFFVSSSQPSVVYGLMLSAVAFFLIGSAVAFQFGYGHRYLIKQIGDDLAVFEAMPDERVRVALQFFLVHFLPNLSVSLSVVSFLYFSPVQAWVILTASLLLYIPMATFFHWLTTRFNLAHGKGALTQTNDQMSKWKTATEEESFFASVNVKINRSESSSSTWGSQSNRSLLNRLGLMLPFAVISASSMWVIFQSAAGVLQNMAWMATVLSAAWMAVFARQFVWLFLAKWGLTKKYGVVLEAALLDDTEESDAAAAYVKNGEIHINPSIFSNLPVSEQKSILAEEERHLRYQKARGLDLVKNRSWLSLGWEEFYVNTWMWVAEALRAPIQFGRLSRAVLVGTFLILSLTTGAWSFAVLLGAGSQGYPVFQLIVGFSLCTSSIVACLYFFSELRMILSIGNFPEGQGVAPELRHFNNLQAGPDLLATVIGGKIAINHRYIGRLSHKIQRRIVNEERRHQRYQIRKGLTHLASRSFLSWSWEEISVNTWLIVAEFFSYRHLSRGLAGPKWEKVLLKSVGFIAQRREHRYRFSLLVLAIHRLKKDRQDEIENRLLEANLQFHSDPEIRKTSIRILKKMGVYQKLIDGVDMRPTGLPPLAVQTRLNFANQAAAYVAAGLRRSGLIGKVTKLTSPDEAKKIKDEIDALSKKLLILVFYAAGLAGYATASEGVGRDEVDAIEAAEVVNRDAPGGQMFFAVDTVEGTNLAATDNGKRAVADLSPTNTGGTTALVIGDGVQSLGNTPDVYADQVFFTVPKEKLSEFETISPEIDDSTVDTALQGIRAFYMKIAEANNKTLADVEVLWLKRDQGTPADGMRDHIRGEAFRKLSEETGLILREFNDGTLDNMLRVGIGSKTGEKLLIGHTTGGSPEAWQDVLRLAPFHRKGKTRAVGAVSIASKESNFEHEEIENQKRAKTAKNMARRRAWTKSESDEIRDLRDKAKQDANELLNGKVIRLGDVKGGLDAASGLITASGIWQVDGAYALSPVQRDGKEVPRFRVNVLRITQDDQGNPYWWIEPIVVVNPQIENIEASDLHQGIRDENIHHFDREDPHPTYPINTSPSTVPDGSVRANSPLLVGLAGFFITTGLTLPAGSEKVAQSLVVIGFILIIVMSVLYSFPGSNSMALAALSRAAVGRAHSGLDSPAQSPTGGATESAVGPLSDKEAATVIQQAAKESQPVEPVAAAIKKIDEAVNQKDVTTTAQFAGVVRELAQAGPQAVPYLRRVLENKNRKIDYRDRYTDQKIVETRRQPGLRRLIEWGILLFLSHARSLRTIIDDLKTSALPGPIGGVLILDGQENEAVSEDQWREDKVAEVAEIIRRMAPLHTKRQKALLLIYDFDDRELATGIDLLLKGSGIPAEHMNINDIGLENLYSLKHLITELTENIKTKETLCAKTFKEVKDSNWTTGSLVVLARDEAQLMEKNREIAEIVSFLIRIGKALFGFRPPTATSLIEGAKAAKQMA